MSALVGAGLLLMAVIALLGIWVPQFRGFWKGSPIPMGTLSTASCAWCMAASGLICLSAAWHLPFPRSWFGFAFVAGFIGAIVGYSIDGEAHRRASPHDLVAPSHRAKKIFAPVGILFAGLTVMALISLLWR